MKDLRYKDLLLITFVFCLLAFPLVNTNKIALAKNSNSSKIIISAPTEIQKEKSFYVKIQAENAPTLNAFEFVLKYNSDKLGYLSSQIGRGIYNWDFFDIKKDSKNGIKVVGLRYQSTNFDGNGTLALISFNTTSTGETNFEIVDEEFSAPEGQMLNVSLNEDSTKIVPALPEIEIITSTRIDKLIYNSLIEDYRPEEISKFVIGKSGASEVNADFTINSMTYQGNTYNSTWTKEDYGIIKKVDDKAIIVGTHRYGTRAGVIALKEKDLSLENPALVHWKDSNGDSEVQYSEIRIIES